MTGGFELTGTGGSDAARNVGASREHYALCWCGHSQNKPFCSGTHWYVNFRDLVGRSRPRADIVRTGRRLPALARMARLFCEKLVPADPLLAPLFADMPPSRPAPEAVEQPALRTPWSPAPQHVGSPPSTPGAGYLHRIATAVLRT